MNEADRKAFEDWGNTKTEWYPDRNMDDTALGMSLAAEDSWSAACAHKEAQHKKEMDEAVKIIEEELATICHLCRRLNPQHEYCNSCPDTDFMRDFLAAHKAKESKGMKKIEITVKDESRDDPWIEEYEIANNENPDGWARALIDRFNNSLRPWETERTVLSVSVIGEDAVMEHQWFKRTDGMSVKFRGEYVDIMECSVCGITGKRYGLSGTVRRDSKYRAKKYEKCRLIEPQSADREEENE